MPLEPIEGLLYISESKACRKKKLDVDRNSLLILLSWAKVKQR
jgi:hypothetical protein